MDYWLATGWGCGMVRTNQSGVIVHGGAAIFRSLKGQLLSVVVKRGKYRCEPLSDICILAEQ